MTTKTLQSENGLALKELKKLYKTPTKFHRIRSQNRKVPGSMVRAMVCKHVMNINFTPKLCTSITWRALFSNSLYFCIITELAELKDSFQSVYP